MALSDKIMDIFERHGAMSSERVTYLLRTEFKINRGLRTIQRHIAKLVEEGKLVPLPSSGREQIYSIFSRKPKAISDHFLAKFWDELFKIRDIIHNSKDQYLVSREALFRLRSLVKMLPEDLKDQINLSIENFFNLDDSEFAELKERYEREVGTAPILTIGGVPFGENEQKRHDRGMNIIDKTFCLKLEDLLEEVSTVVHQALGERKQ